MIHDGWVTRPTFVFDGDCAFCSSCARFIERRIRPAVDVVAWQFADLDALGVTEDEVSGAVYFVGPGRTSAGPAAIADMLRTAGPVWRVSGAILAVRPITTLAWPVYRWIARNRHRMPGGTAAWAVWAGKVLLLALTGIWVATNVYDRRHPKLGHPPFDWRRLRPRPRPWAAESQTLLAARESG